MLSTLKDAWGIPEIRKKIIFTLIMMFIYRIGSAIPVPYMNIELIKQLFESTQGSMLDFMDMMSGGNFSRFSIFAANIYPYITASIVIQLLTFAIPSLEELSKEGAEGRKKIENYTKITSIILAFMQAIGFTFGIFKSAVETTNMLQNIVVVFSIVGGTCFLVWVGNQITEHGIGNGISIIIFLGIVGRLPLDLRRVYFGVQAGKISILATILFLIFAVFIVFVVVAINEGERRVPVQYAKRVIGRKLYGGQNTHIPIKVAMAGVMPIIFSSAILSIPGMITMMSPESGVGRFFATWFTTQTIRGTVMYTVLNIIFIILFTFFYTSMQFNTVEYSKTLQQNGGFIPGIRPGRPTSDYLTKVVNRLTIVGAIILAFLSTLPTFLTIFAKIPVAFGGTSLIIVVGVVIETVKALEQMMLIRHYKGFLG